MAIETWHQEKSLSRTLREAAPPLLFLTPAAIVLLVFMAVPVINAVLLSLQSWNGMTPAVWVGLSNYASLFRDRIFLFAFGNTAYFTIVTVIFQTIVPLLIAILLNAGIRGSTVFRTLYFMPVIISLTISGLLWAMIYEPNFGMLNSLLQGVGHRRWQIETHPDPEAPYRDDVPLRLLRDFHPDHEWVLGPGDMLYLPPGVAHHGVAEDACLTISIGLRAPSTAELLIHQADTLAFDADERVRYVDPDLALPADPNEIDDAALDRALAALARIRLEDRDQIGEWFGRFISAYRVAEGQAPTGDDASGLDIVASIQDGATWMRHPHTRMAWRRASDGSALLFANGAAWPATVEDARVLAAAQWLDGETLSALGPAGRALAQTLADGGYLQPVEE